MRRRAFIVVLAGAAAWPLAGHAQQPEQIRVIGALMPWPEKDPVAQASMAALTQALGRLGWVQGKNIRIDYCFAGNDPTLFKPCAPRLAGLSPAVILAGAPPSVIKLRRQTRTIPIVIVLVADPVGLGFVQSFPRPGGNITGFSAFDPALMGKWLQLLKDVDPSVKRVAVIFDPDTTPSAPLFNRAIEAAAGSFGVKVTLAPVHDDAEIEEAIAVQAHEPGGGLLCLPDNFSITHRHVIIGAAARHGLPLISGIEVFPKDGALMSYWYDTVDQYAQGASYIDRILRGAGPADLPVQQPVKYSLIINLKTAKALGLTIPPNVLELADEVIE